MLIEVQQDVGREVKGGDRDVRPSPALRFIPHGCSALAESLSRWVQVERVVCGKWERIDTKGIAS